MILGNPDKFAIIMEVVNDWNIDQSFNNGVLFFTIEGKIFPCNEVVNATLNSEIPQLKRCISSVGTDERLFSLPKDEAFTEMYNLRSPKDWSIDADYRFDISPLSFSDKNCLKFAVSDGKQVRILAVADLEYIIAESRYNLKNIDISEVYITVAELNDILLKLSIYDNKFERMM